MSLSQALNQFAQNLGRYLYPCRGYGDTNTERLRPGIALANPRPQPLESMPVIIYRWMALSNHCFDECCNWASRSLIFR